jgi:predicted nucleic acid-binding protein
VDKFVLDACAVIALIKGEQGSDVVKKTIESDSEIFLHAVTFLEVYYNVVKEFGTDKANTFFNWIVQIGIEIIYEITEETIKCAGYFKSKYKISLGDSFVLAVAKLNSAKIVSSDHHEFDTIQNQENIGFVWVR